MRVFAGGASGWIGSAVVPELIGAGRRVIGLRRAAPSADAQTVASEPPRRRPVAGGGGIVQSFRRLGGTCLSKQ
jgi:nucleoside-diphosphate-sugar epimerase